MQAVVLFESLFGTTERAARLIADGFHQRGWPTRVFPVDVVDQDEVREAVDAADLVVVGSWTDGFLVVGQRPGRSGKLKALPDLSGKKAVVFCTYAVNPGRTLDKLQRKVERHGAEVLGGMALHRKELVDGTAELVARVGDAVAPA